MDIIERLQPHTVRIYNLKTTVLEEKTVPARMLLVPFRFDLFAKLFYIRNRDVNKELALKIYREHIKALNPDLKEPGRNDKSGYEDFISSFDRLIEDFKSESFDSTQSLVPVTDNYVILDGAHRVAALSYFDKEIGVAQCHGIVPKADFDYLYFKNRGLSWDTMDLIANEMIRYLSNIYVACIWPKIVNKAIAVSLIKKHFNIVYEKSLRVTFASFRQLITEVYKNQLWIQNQESLTDKALQCFGFNRQVTFIFFVADNMCDVLSIKDAIRYKYGFGKHSVHITDNIAESQAIAENILVASKREKWNAKSITGTLFEKFSERWFYFKKVQFINFKIAVTKLLHIGR